MGDSRAAVGMDRLPWLPDEPSRRRATIKSRTATNGHFLGWAFGALLLVAAVSYWLGTRTVEQSPVVASPSSAVPLPVTSEAEPAEQVQPLAPPDVRPLVQPEVRRVVDRQTAVSRPTWRPLPRQVPNEVAERVERTIATEEADKVAGAQTGVVPKTESAAPTIPNTQNVKLWPARESAATSGSSTKAS